MSDSSGLVTVIAPDGSIGAVPQGRVQDAINAGGSLGVDLIAPDGSPGVVPMDKVHDAIKSGARLATANPGALPKTLPGNPSGTNIAGGLVTAGDALQNTGIGLAKGLEQTIEGGGALIRKGLGMPQVNDTSRPELQQQGTAQNVGGGIENVLEFVAGDEALKGLSLSEKLAKVGKVAEFLEAHPNLASLLGVSLRQGAVGTAQGLAHGESPQQALTTGAVTGAAGGVSEGLTQGIQAIAPKTTEIAGKAIPVLATQTEDAGIGTNVAKTVADSGFTGRKQLSNFAENQASAAKDALSNVADDTAQKTVSDLNMSGRGPARQALSQSNSFEDSAQKIKDAAKEHFQDINEATEGEFDQLQAERSDTLAALRRTTKVEDMQDLRTTLKELDAKEGLLFDAYSTSVSPADRQGLIDARAAWKQANAQEELHSRIAKALSGSPDDIDPLTTSTGETIKQTPETINGSMLLRQLRSMDSDTLNTALGNSSAHRAALYNLADLLQNSSKATQATRVVKWIERGVAASSAGAAFGHVQGLAALAGIESASGVMGTIMTSPKASTALYTGLKSGRAIPGIADAVMFGLQQDKKGQQ